MQLWRMARADALIRSQAVFGTETREITGNLSHRMKVYEQVLRGAQGLFSASHSVESDEFRIYVEQLRLNENYPGIQGLGFSLIVPPAQKEAHVAAVRRENLRTDRAEYSIHPQGKRDYYTSVIYIEPFSAENRRAYGYDMYSDREHPREGDSAPGMRREAMDFARDTGQAAISGRVHLLMENGRDNHGDFLMYLPVYRKGTSHGTVAERRANIIGWVYAPFHADELIGNLLGEHGGHFDLELFDGEEMSVKSLLYDYDRDHSIAHESDFQSIQRLDIAQRRWIVVIYAYSDFGAELDNYKQWYIGVGGVAFGTLLALLTWLLVRGRERAMRFADEMNRDLIVSEARLSAMLDNIPYLTWLKDTGGKFIAVNRTFLKTTGKRHMHEVLGKTDFELWPRELAEKYRADDDEVMKTRRQKSDTERSVMEGGRIAWVDTFKSPIIDGNGTLLGTAGIAQDVTGRKQNEAKIDRLSRMYMLLSRANEAIVRARDRDELFEAICAVAVASGLFRLVWIGMLDERKLAVLPVAHAGVEEGYTNRLHIRLDDERTGKGPAARAIRADAPICCQDIQTDPSMVPWREEALKRGYASSAAFPLHEGGAVVGTINVYAVDVHFFTLDIYQLLGELAANLSFSLDVFAEKERRKSAEEGLRKLNIELESRVLERTYQLEGVNRELEAFSYSVSHDLRAPLRSIGGFSQILIKKYHAQLDETGQSYLERVSRASQHMGVLIDDLLMLSQVTRTVLERKQVDLSAIAQEVMEGLHKASPERIAKCILQPEVLVHADHGLMRIAMDNLLGNAWKYTGKKTGAEIEFGAHEINGERIFFVRDNGAGFNMEYAHKLFGAFQRLHSTHEFEGTGIGLATVQRIIHRHHGRIWAEATEGQGAAFYFTLPQRERDMSG